MHPKLLTAGGAGLKAETAHSCNAAWRPAWRPMTPPAL